MSYALDDLLQEQELRFKLAPDWEAASTAELAEAFDYFCKTYWHIRHPSKGRIKFDLSPEQRETVDHLLEHRYNIILKARQLGFSTLIGAFATWATYFYPDRHIIMLSKGEREAIKLLAKCKYGFKYLPDWMKLSGPIWDNKQTSISFSNESIVESLPSGNDPARGESVWMLVLDEWSFLPNPDEAWASVEATTDIGGRVIGLSTANGEGNIFHEKWLSSSGSWTDQDGVEREVGTGTGEFNSIFFGWWADGAGQRDQEWHDNKSANTADWQMAQEYPSSPDEAFLRSGRPIFNVDALALIECDEPDRGFLARDSKGCIEYRLDGGNLAVWSEPRENGVYVMGVDVSEGLEHGDWTSIHIIDARNKMLAAHWHGKVDADLLGQDLLPLLGEFYHNALIAVESNNHGLTTLKALQRMKYRNIFKERPHGKTTEQATQRLGFRTTQTSKPLIIDGLGALLRDKPGWMMDAKTLQELKTFVREGSGKMHGSPWDDRTMSLAIAVHMLQFAWLDEYTITEAPGPGTFGYFEEMTYGKETKEKEVAIGTHSIR